MKKTTRSLLISALILFCAGLLLTICASLYAKIADIEVYDFPKKARTIETVSIPIDDILKQSPESNFVNQVSETKFNRVNLTSFTGDVVICTSKKDAELHLDQTNTNNIVYSVVGDTLTVSEDDAVGFMGFYIDNGGVSFEGLRHMFNPGNATNSEKTITLRIPSDLTLAQIDVSSSIGNITIDGISANVINVKSGTGTVKIENLKNPEGKIKVSGNFTDVKMKKNFYANCAIDTHFGNIETHLLKDTNGSTILDLWCGDVKVVTDNPTTYYKLSVSVSAGSITRNSKDFGEKLNTDGSGAARISSGIFWGDFELKYSGGKEDPVSQPAPDVPPVSDEATAPEGVAPEATA